MKYRNPIIPGFYPDPSICRVGDTFYMVCSSFQFFPGVPLFESRDLLNWTQIGHVLTRESQLPLKDANSVGGIYAPTIRYHNGRFYMVTTNVSFGGNFYVWTDDIHGEWSEPIRVEQDGIDPSLYFEDGKAYFMSNGTDDAGMHGVVQCEIDIETGRKLTPAKCIWQGTGGRFLESPHLYKIGGRYYLMAAEGGTEYGHMIVYARGSEIYGPFESYAHNPVLTNRNLGGYVLQGCGHGDLVDDVNGNWWMVHLAFRQIDQWVMHHTTGREVNLVPVTFDADGWFTAGDNGTTRLVMETDRIAADVVQQPIPDKTFANTKVGVDWCYMRNPDFSCYELSETAFRMRGTKDTLETETGRPTFLGIRQQEMKQEITCTVSVPAGEAGMTLYMTAEQHYDIAVSHTETGSEVILRRRVGDLIVVDGHIPVPSGAKVQLRMDCDNFAIRFTAVCDGTTYALGSGQTKYLSTELAGNFTGVMIGLYAKETGDAFAEFTEFCCRCLEKYDAE
ncbi:MAG: glycoside hydrolase family 43 protein [Oscillospiraceae bacterium]|nr:glycoside hydrolase family 43 protein [Oscillospiraceae bacterium]